MQCWQPSISGRRFHSPPMSHVSKNQKWSIKQVFISDHNLWTHFRWHSYRKGVTDECQMRISICPRSRQPWSCQPWNCQPRSCPCPQPPSSHWVNHPQWAQAQGRQPSWTSASVKSKSFRSLLRDPTQLENDQLTSWSRSSHQQQPRWEQFLQSPAVERKKMKCFKIFWCFDASPAPLDLASFFSLSKRSSAHVCSARELEAE